MAESVTERRIRPIEDAVASGNWKQAWKECEKWHKKGEKSDRFLALKAHVLVHQSDQAQRDRGQTETLQLVRRDPFLADKRSIELLESALGELSLTEEANKFWDRVIANAENKELAMEHLHRCIAINSWSDAQKTTTALRKAFPKERQYEFWNITMCYLVYLDPTVDKNQRNLLGTLAYRMLAKAAEAVPTNKKQLLSPGKFIATPEELFLLVHVYLKTGRASEAATLLTSPAFDMYSQIALQDPRVHFQLHLRALEESEQWEDAFLLCKTLLEVPGNEADDSVWALLLKAESFAGPEKQKAEIEQVLTDFTDPNRAHIRAAYAAKLRYLTSHVKAGTKPSADLLSLCKQYFPYHQGKIYLFLDLRDHLPALSQKDRQIFRLYLTQLVETQAYPRAASDLILFERVVNPTPSDVPALLRRATSALTQYQTAQGTSMPFPQGATMTALDLVQAAMLSGNIEYLLRAVLFLEVARAQNEDMFPISVLLVECYIKLGLGSRAMDVFLKLNMKNLQYDSAAHLLLTRISTFHPHTSASEGLPLDPLKTLVDGLDVLQQFDVSVPNGVRVGLTNGSYSNIMNLVEAKSFFRFSMNKWLYRIEYQRVKRLFNSYPHLVPEIPDSELHDKRDYGFLPHFVEGDGRLHDYLRAGPKPGRTYIDGMFFVENVVEFLKFDLEGDKKRAATAYNRTQGAASLNEFSVHDFRNDMTGVERSLLDFALCVLRVIAWVKEGQSTPEAIISQVKEIEVSLKNAIQFTKKSTGTWETNHAMVQTVRGIRVPVWEYLHDSYYQLELCVILGLFLDWMKKHGKSKGVQQTKQEVSFDGAKVMSVLAGETADFWAARKQSVAIDEGKSDSSTENTVDFNNTDSEGKTNGTIVLDQERLLNWASLIEELSTEVRESALQVHSSFNGRNVVHKLVDVAFAHDESEKDEVIREENEKWEQVMLKLCEKDAARDLVKNTCKSIQASWRDSVTGILEVEGKRKK